MKTDNMFPETTEAMASLINENLEIVNSEAEIFSEVEYQENNEESEHEEDFKQFAIDEKEKGDVEDDNQNVNLDKRDDETDLTIIDSSILLKKAPAIPDFKNESLLGKEPESKSSKEMGFDGTEKGLVISPETSKRKMKTAQSTPSLGALNILKDPMDAASYISLQNPKLMERENNPSPKVTAPETEKDKLKNETLLPTKSTSKVSTKTSSSVIVSDKSVLATMPSSDKLSDKVLLAKMPSSVKTTDRSQLLKTPSSDKLSDTILVSKTPSSDKISDKILKTPSAFKISDKSLIKMGSKTDQSQLLKTPSTEKISNKSLLSGTASLDKITDHSELNTPSSDKLSNKLIVEVPSSRIEDKLISQASKESIEQRKQMDELEIGSKRLTDRLKYGLISLMASNSLFGFSSQSFSEEDGKKLLLKYYLTDDIERVIVLPARSNCMIKDILEELAYYVHKDPEDIQLFYDGKKMHRKDQLENHLIGNETELHIEVKFEFDSSDDESIMTHKTYESDYRIQKVKVRTLRGEDNFYEVLVHNIAFTKEWCGGYRNKNTGIIYHNAWTQTNPRPRPKDTQLFGRITQTYVLKKDNTVNTPYGKSTQMWRADHYVPSANDKIITSRPYVEFQIANKQLTPDEAVRILQRFFRSVVLRKKLRETLFEIKKQNEAALNFKGLRNAQIHRERMTHLIKQTFPYGRGDFYDLYTILGIWKKQAKERVREEKDGVGLKASLFEVFEKELECLYHIETQRIRSKEENLKSASIKALEFSAGYKVVRYSKGNITIIDTLATQRGREFKEIFSSYLRFDDPPEIRLDTLITMTNMLGKIPNIDMTKDIIALLNRECDLIMSNISNDKLIGLRKRVESMFLSLMKEPELNPQSKKLRKTLESRMKQPLYRCKGCLRIKSPAFFFSHLRLPAFKFCASCSWMNTTANATINLAPYTKLLNTLRETETKKCCRGTTVFLLQPMGMYYIMNVIWRGQSIISGSTYLPELRMTRWNKFEEWAPWNTVLVTEAEAIVHDSLDDPENFYTRWFVLNVKNKHILSRMHFDLVYYTDLELRESGKWTQAKDQGFYTSRRHYAKLRNQFKNYFFEPTPDQIYYGGDPTVKKVSVGV